MTLDCVFENLIVLYKISFIVVIVDLTFRILTCRFLLAVVSRT